jgi:dCTP deaminase
MTGFLTDIEIKEKIGEEVLIDQNYNEKCLDSIMYDLRLGKENYITPIGQKLLEQDSDFITIEPDQTAILTTYEHIKLPSDIFGMITIKFTHKSKGLINISGFHVDPGFSGYLVFSVYNAGKKSITFHFKDQVFSILFYQLHREVPTKDRFFEHIPTSIIDHYESATFPSIIEMEKKLNEHSTQISFLRALFIGLFLALITIIINLISKST